MATALLMPKPGQMTETCSIIKWLKKEGDAVAKGDILYEIETDKAAMEVESFAEGTLLKIVVPPGRAVPVQTVVGFVGKPGEAVPDVSPPSDASQTAVDGPMSRVQGQTGAPGTSASPLTVDLGPGTQASLTLDPGSRTTSPPAASASVFRISPRAARLARESAIDPTPLRGTGPGGRVVEKDIKAYLDVKGYGRLRITPAAKALAIREKIDILGVEGTGEGGRIGVEDVRRAAAERPKPMSRIRQVIAERLTRSVVTSPHFFVTVAVDMTDLAAWRAELKAAGSDLSFNVFVLAACARALHEVPEVNSSTDGRTERRHGRIHIGMAVNLPGGLVVPVVRDADRLSLMELQERSAALAAKAREGRLAPDEMTGGTFTVSNMGMLDVENFTAIINPGESAILAVSSIRLQPAVRDGAVVPRSVMKITLSADHRILDGAVAARFVNAVRSNLEAARDRLRT